MTLSTGPTALSPLARQLVPLVEAAGAAILAHYADTAEADTKADGSPLTLADLASHRLICAGLADTGLPVLSEESAPEELAERRHWSRYWLVDPLDGTKEFLARNGEFTVNIALIDQHQPVLGVVYAPVLALLYLGEAGKGAWRRDAQGWQAITARQHTVNAEQPLVVVASRRHGFERVQALLADLPHTLDNRGSSLKICRVAEGAADLYPRLGSTSEWDTAAAQAVLEAAGGSVRDVQDAPLRYNQRDGLLNPDFYCYGAAPESWAVRLNKTA